MLFLKTVCEVQLPKTKSLIKKKQQKNVPEKILKYQKAQYDLCVVSRNHKTKINGEKSNNELVDIGN